MEEVDIRDVPGWPGYGAGSDGEVYSKRTRSGALASFWRKMSACPTGDYLGVALNINGKGYYRKVHILVALAWIGPNYEKSDVHHVNEDKRDNRPGNLRYKTRAVHKKKYHSKPKVKERREESIDDIPIDPGRCLYQPERIYISIGGVVSIE